MPALPLAFPLDTLPSPRYGETNAGTAKGGSDDLLMERVERLKLIVIKGADEGKQFELSEPVVGLGRDPGNLIRLNDTEISRRHAEIFQKPGDGRRYFVRDVGSANGTFVNDTLVNEAPLQPGDQIQIGQSVLVLSGGRAPEKE